MTLPKPFDAKPKLATKKGLPQNRGRPIYCVTYLSLRDRRLFPHKFTLFKPTGLNRAVRQGQHTFSMALAVRNGSLIVRTVRAVKNHKAPQIPLVKFARIAIAIGQP